jgi:O-antigen ligase
VGGLTESTRLPIWLKYPYFVSVAALVPLISPSLPLNSEFVDYVNALFFFALWIPLLMRRRFEGRLYVPMGVIFLGSLIAMFNSPALATCVTTLVQEVYLFVFFLTLYNVIESDADIRALVLPWLVFAAVEGVIVLSQLRADPVLRARGTFDNPNMAASYLGISSFLLLQPVARIPWPARALFLFLTWGGMFATKSLSALLACILGLGSMSVVYAMQGRAGNRLKIVLGLAAVVILIVGVTLTSGQSISNYLDRLPRSTDERTAIWKTGVKTFLENPLGIGIGPAGFAEVEFVRGGHYGVGRRISLHNDYLAYLVERGVLGFCGLAGLLGTMAYLAYRAIKGARSNRGMLWALGLSGMFVYILVDAMTHEVTHYRHVWLAFGLIAAQARLADRAGRAPESDRQPTAPSDRSSGRD